MDKGTILANLQKSIETWNVELAKKTAQEALDAGIPPAEAVENGLGKGMEVVSQKFDEAKIYLPQVLAASNAMEAALKIFEPHLKGAAVATKGTVVIGTVIGDIHEIGKNVVAAMLTGAGYKVIDLGRDVPIETFVDSVKTNKADVIGASALMTTTVVGQKEIMEMLKEEKVTVKSIFGGAPCNEEWVKSIGGDAYCPSGAEAAAIVDQLMKG
ncbi:MAG: corrinoid protein [Methanomassiliicoccus sp.]|nr:corrinoid protein [Methanomassiliicoccus sp.]